jgi:WD40 repeat protein
MENTPPKDSLEPVNDQGNGKLELFRLEACPAGSTRINRRNFIKLTGAITTFALLEACKISSILPTTTPTSSPSATATSLPTFTPSPSSTATETPQPTSTPSPVPTPTTENFYSSCENNYAMVMAHTDQIYQLEFSPSGKYLVTVSGSGDRTDKIWDAGSYELIQTIPSYEYIFAEVAFLNSDTILAYPDPGDEGKINLWDIPAGNSLEPLLTQAGDKIELIVVSKSLGKLVFTTFDGRLGVMDIASRTTEKYLPTTTTVSGMDISPDGKLLVVGGMQRLELWDITSGQLIADTAPIFDTLTYNTKYRFSPDGSLLLALDTLLQVPSLKEVRRLYTNEGSLAFYGKPSFSPDGRLIAQSIDGSLIGIWDSASGYLLKTIRIDNDPTAVSFSADGKNLVVGGIEGELMILDAVQFDSDQTICFFDAAATSNQANIVVYKKEDAYGVVRTYAVGGETGQNEIPAGATCVCNSVEGTYQAPDSGGGSGGYCSCNMVCVCMAV